VKSEYDTFVASIKDLPEGQEVELFIRDLAPGRHKYKARYVKAVVSRSAAQLPQGDTLWLRSLRGKLYPQPWVIQILAEVEGYMPPASHVRW
jgi:hypothetical protein